eukprot:1707606-Alexandrium_andersonii.AAC.1
MLAIRSSPCRVVWWSLLSAFCSCHDEGRAATIVLHTVGCLCISMMGADRDAVGGAPSHRRQDI